VQVPNADQAIIAPEKIMRYLLVPEHPQNQGKAAFFLRFGFTRGRWQVLAAALAEHVRAHEIEHIIPEVGRTKYTVVGSLRMPDGRSPLVRTVWQVDVGSAFPRFITAYPHEERNVP
jgi:hypothetical protein